MINKIFNSNKVYIKIITYEINLFNSNKSILKEVYGNVCIYIFKLYVEIYIIRIYNNKRQKNLEER